jgi:hypothetical protein
MSAQQVDSDMDDLLPDELRKGAAVPLVRTPKQTKALEARAEKQTLEAAAKANAARLAQIVNLHIAGFSLADIGASIGASADEVDRLLTQDAARYVRSQPALRTYVRNWISSKYMTMIETDWAQATDPKHGEHLEHQDRVMRMLDGMRRLHGADAPVQSEVKIDAAPEAVEKLVAALAATQGLGYDMDIFDADVVEDALAESDAALEVSGNAVSQPQEGDPEDGF